MELKEYIIDHRGRSIKQVYFNKPATIYKHINYMYFIISLCFESWYHFEMSSCLVDEELNEEDGMHSYIHTTYMYSQSTGCM